MAFLCCATASVSARECVRARLGVPPGLLLCRQPENLSVRLISRRFRCEGGAPHQNAPLRSHGMLPDREGGSVRFGLLLCRQPENLSVRLVSRRFRCEGGAPHQRAPLRSHGLLPPHRGISFKIVSGGWVVGWLHIYNSGPIFNYRAPLLIILGRSLIYTKFSTCVECA